MSITSDPDVDVLIENVAWLLEQGEHPTRVLQRVDRSASALTQTLRRAGRGDLAAPFETTRRREDERKANT